MRKFLIASIAAISMSAHAQISDQDLALCKVVGEVAQITMVNRQYGVDMRTMMQKAGDNPLAIAIVTDAYREPLHSSASKRLASISAFKTATINVCIKNKMGK